MTNTCDNIRKRYKRVLGNQYLTNVVTSNHPVEFVKCPINFEYVNYKDRRLYINYLDCKAQTQEGIFRVYRGKAMRTYYRVVSQLVSRGWASWCKEAEGGHISLRAYQFVWRDLGIQRLRVKERRFGFVYYKIPIENLDPERGTYIKQIDDLIKKKLAERRARQIRWNLKKKGIDSTEANFSGMSSALLFGYRSASTGSKLRKKNFSVIPGPSTPFFNKARGRYEEPTKRIAL